MGRDVVVAVLIVLTLSGCSRAPDELPVWSAGSGTENPRPPTAAAPDGEVPVLVEAECDDGGDCAAGFLVSDRFYELSCGAVRAALVTDEVVARGELYGDVVEVRTVDGASDDVLVAVSLEGGRCGDGDVALSPWSMAFPSDASQRDVEMAICVVVVAEQKRINNCG